MKTIYSIILSVLITACVSIFILTPAIMAESQDDLIAPLNTGGMESPITSYGQIADLLISVVKWFYTLVFVVAVLFILVAAYNFITSGGDEKKVSTAKAYLKWAIIGIAIALVSAGIAELVKSFLGSGSSGGDNCPLGGCSV